MEFSHYKTSVKNINTNFPVLFPPFLPINIYADLTNLTVWHTCFSTPFYSLLSMRRQLRPLIECLAFPFVVPSHYHYSSFFSPCSYFYIDPPISESCLP